VKLRIAGLVGVALLGLSACTRQEPPSALEGTETRDTPAKAAGRAAYKIAEETKEAAKKAGRELSKATKEAREGWKEAADEERKKPGK
jgi:uncharacterized protein with WD repeat